MKKKIEMKVTDEKIKEGLEQFLNYQLNILGDLEQKGVEKHSYVSYFFSTMKLCKFYKILSAEELKTYDTMFNHKLGIKYE